MRQVFRRMVAGMALAPLLAVAGCAYGGPTGVAAPTEAPVLVQHPTATPIPTPTDPTGQALERTAQSAVGSAARSVGVMYDASAKNLTVTVTIDGVVPLTSSHISAAYARVKALTFQEMSGLWDSGLPLRQVTVIVLGPTLDEYDTMVNQWYGIAALDNVTARHVSWASATPESAWNVYNQAFLRQSFDVFDEIPPAPPAPTATTAG